MKTNTSSTSDANWDELWKKYSSAYSINPAQDYRRKLIFSYLEKNNDGQMNILDIGSGNGDFLLEVYRRFPKAKILGIEKSSVANEIAKKLIPSADFILQDLTTSTSPPEKFKNWATHAICSEVLEHIAYPQLVLKNISPYLRKNCKLIITVPGGPMSAFDRHIGHYRHFTSDTLRKVIEENGDKEYEISHLSRAGFPFHNIYRFVVISRGKKLIEDVKANTHRQSGSFLSNFVMHVFSFLFKFNIDSSRFGFQNIAVAKKK